MNSLRFGLLVLALLLGGCGTEASMVGEYHIEQDGYGFGPGADKIILDLRPDKTFDVKAGPLELVAGTWEANEGKLTLSKGQGAIATSYRSEGTKLIPVVDGKDATGWRWAR